MLDEKALGNGRAEGWGIVNILIADDEDIVRYALRSVLERAGHTVFEARDGVDALGLLAGHPIDVALVDMIMPNKEGVETTIEIRRQYPSVKVVAISGGGRSHNFDFLQYAQKFGAHSTLRKPFTDEQLLESVTT